MKVLHAIFRQWRMNICITPLCIGMLPCMACMTWKSFNAEFMCGKISSFSKYKIHCLYSLHQCSYYSSIHECRRVRQHEFRNEERMKYRRVVCHKEKKKKNERPFIRCPLKFVVIGAWKCGSSEEKKKQTNTSRRALILPPQIIQK